MTALLTDNLPLLAGAPSGIKKLRELILELAVRGKLVPQDANDEPASELLKRIGEEKARLVAEGKVKKQKPLVELADDKKPFELPQSWEWRRISDLLPESQNGASSRGDSDGLSVTVLRLADIREGEISLDDTRTLVLSAASVRKYALEDGDVLLIRVNGSADLVGRFVVCRANLQAIPCDHFIRMRFPRGVVDSGYLKIVGDSKLARNAIARLFVSTAGQKTVNQGHIGSLSVPLPPIAEQHRIVSKVDELMALCDRLEARQADADSAHAQLVHALLGSLTQASDATDFAQSWPRLAEHFDTLFTTESSIDALKQALLQLAVMGKLVPQDPSDEPASELLKRIAEERAQAASQGRGRKVKTATDYRASNTEVTVPAGWSLSTVGEVTICRDGERIAVSQAEREGRPKTYDYYGASGVIDKIDGFLFDKPLLLVGEDGANLINRSTPIAFMARGKYWVNNHAHVLDGVSEALLLYVQLYFNAIDLKPYVTGTAQPKMNQAKMNSIVLLLPPEAEQHRIVAKVDQLMALCDQLKARLNQARQVHGHLASVLVEQAVA